MQLVIDGTEAPALLGKISDFIASLTDAAPVAGEPEAPKTRRARKVEAAPTLTATSSPERPVAPAAAQAPLALPETTQAPPAPTPSAPPAAAGKTRDEALKALEALSQKHGLNAALAKLKEFGVGRMSELPAAKYGEFVTNCETETAKPVQAAK